MSEVREARKAAVQAVVDQIGDFVANLSDSHRIALVSRNPLDDNVAITAGDLRTLIDAAMSHIANPEAEQAEREVGS